MTVRQITGTEGPSSRDFSLGGNQDVKVHLPKGTDLTVFYDDSKQAAADQAAGSSRRITWIAWFSVKDSAGRNFVNNMHYTITFNKPAGTHTYYYYDAQGLHSDQQPQDVPGTGRVQMTFSNGDPGVGLT